MHSFFHVPRRVVTQGPVGKAATAAILAAGLFVVSGLASSPAQAQILDTQQFRFSPHALDLFQVESAKVSAGFTPNAFVGFNYATGLLKANGPTGDSKNIVDSLATMNVLGSISLDEWVSVGLDIPMHLARTGSLDPFNPNSTNLSGFSMGDIQIGVKTAFVRPTRTGVGIGMSFTANLATSTPSDPELSFTGENASGVTAKLLADAHMAHFRVMLNAGYRVRPESLQLGNQEYGDELLTAIGFGVPLWNDQIEIIQETTFATQKDRVFDEDSSRLELHGGVRYRNADNGLYAAVGAGGGLMDAPGNADFRVFGMFGYRPAHFAVLDSDGDGVLDDVDQCVNDPEDIDGFQDADGCPDPDNDGDGILDVDDQCPNDPEDFDGFNDEDGCPDLDNDGDGIPDVSDKCPNNPEDFDGDMDEDGCPDLDTDGDGIPDYADQCVNDPEDIDGFEDEDGCPDPDNDKDGIPDVRDKCPNEPEDFDGCQDHDGCPEESRVCVTDDAIVILDKIFFQTGKAKILPESFPLLDELAGVMKTTPGLKKIEVQGHTDSRGSDRSNKRLSDNRAKAVRKHLIKLGVDRRILEARGYGEERPIGDNETEEGREKNRRVEFKILQRDPGAVEIQQ